MSRIPAELKYARSHEWPKHLPDGTIEIGISDHAQKTLGDLVFVGLLGLINRDLYGGGWMMRLQSAVMQSEAALLSARD